MNGIKQDRERGSLRIEQECVLASLEIELLISQSEL